MKKIYFFWSFCCLFYTATLFGQRTSPTLLKWNKNRIETNRKAMLVLGSWAVGNIALGSVMQSKTEGRTKAWHQMNAGWNLVNLGLATVGYVAAVKSDPSQLVLYESINAHHNIQKVFLFNAGLDVGYMLGGAYLIEKSKNTVDIKKSDRFKGFGQSIVLQGVFLFAFDMANFVIHNNRTEQIKPLLEIGSTKSGNLGLTLHF